jgi:5'-nucleotidase
MADDLSNVLVVGVSSRALFDLEADNVIFENEGLEVYTDRQLTNTDIPPAPRFTYFITNVKSTQVSACRGQTGNHSPFLLEKNSPAEQECP